MSYGPPSMSAMVDAGQRVMVTTNSAMCEMFHARRDDWRPADRVGTELEVGG